MDVQLIDSVEALTWLEQDDGKERAISESSEQQIAGDDLMRLVRELYAAGAVEVRVNGIEAMEDFEDGTVLEITLPQDKKARSALFAIQGRVLREIGSAYDQDEEQGQASIGIAW